MRQMVQAQEELSVLQSQVEHRSAQMQLRRTRIESRTAHSRQQRLLNCRLRFRRELQ